MAARSGRPAQEAPDRRPGDAPRPRGPARGHVALGPPKRSAARPVHVSQHGGRLRPVRRQQPARRRPLVRRPRGPGEGRARRPLEGRPRDQRSLRPRRPTVDAREPRTRRRAVLQEVRHHLRSERPDRELRGQRTRRRATDTRPRRSPRPALAQDAAVRIDDPAQGRRLARDPPRRARIRGPSLQGAFDASRGRPRARPRDAGRGALRARDLGAHRGQRALPLARRGPHPPGGGVRRRPDPRPDPCRPGRAGRHGGLVATVPRPRGPPVAVRDGSPPDRRGDRRLSALPAADRRPRRRRRLLENHRTNRPAAPDRGLPGPLLRLPATDLRRRTSLVAERLPQLGAPARRRGPLLRERAGEARDLRHPGPRRSARSAVSRGARPPARRKPRPAPGDPRRLRRTPGLRLHRRRVHRLWTIRSTRRRHPSCFCSCFRESSSAWPAGAPRECSAPRTGSRLSRS